MKYLLVFMLCPLLFYAECAKVHPFEQVQSWQFWDTNSVHVHLHQNLALIGELELHYSKKGGAFHYKHYQGGLLFAPSPYVSITTSCRYTLQGEKSPLDTECYPLVDITLQTQAESWWQLSNRCRLLHRRSPEKQQKEWLYSNCLKLLSCLSDCGTNFYCSEEFFWGRSRGFNENRLIIGIDIPYHTCIRLDFYYMFRSLIALSKRWDSQSIYGVHFSLYF